MLSIIMNAHNGLCHGIIHYQNNYNSQNMNDWHPTSWRKKNCWQAVSYPCQQTLDETVRELSQKPALVALHHIQQLKKNLSDASLGHGFVLQAGPCAEQFSDCTPPYIQAEINLFNQLAETLTKGLSQPLIKIGRIAGQYAKPRSQLTETQNGETLPLYRGDSINRSEFTFEARNPDPKRMLEAYRASQKTLMYFQSDPFFVSHEALLLYYEEAMTHQHEKGGQWFNASTHFPWLGMRTGQLEGAHVEYLRGISNPIGIKIGPHTSAQWLIELLSMLNPSHEKGRITLITRLGVDTVQECLPDLIRAVQNHHQPVLWMCDPMHGNTRSTASNIKTRYLDDIARDLFFTTAIHHKMRSFLGGLHLEISSDPVTECLGGKNLRLETDLKKNYRSPVDPRLNPSQALELVESFISYYQKLNVLETLK